MKWSLQSESKENRTKRSHYNSRVLFQMALTVNNANWRYQLGHGINFIDCQEYSDFMIDRGTQKLLGNRVTTRSQFTR